MKHWSVCTPQYWTYDYYQIDPPEYGADCVSVEAPNRRRARVEGVRELRKMRSDWLLDQQSDKRSPFTGLQVFPASCEHGNCWCDICTKKPEWVECSECMKESERLYEEELAR